MLAVHGSFSKLVGPFFVRNFLSCFRFAFFEVPQASSCTQAQVGFRIDPRPWLLYQLNNTCKIDTVCQAPKSSPIIDCFSMGAVPNPHPKSQTSGSQAQGIWFILLHSQRLPNPLINEYAFHCDRALSMT